MSQHTVFSHLRVIGTTHTNGAVNSAVLWLRVHPSTLQILARSIVALLDSTDGGGQDVVGVALGHVLNQSGQRGSVAFQPREWYAGNGDGEGGVFAQIVEGNAAQRVDRMEAVLGKAKRGEFEQGLSEDSVQRFWAVVGEARRVLSEARDKGVKEGEGEVGALVEGLIEQVEMRAWETEEALRRVRVVKDMLDID